MFTKLLIENAYCIIKFKDTYTESKKKVVSQYMKKWNKGAEGMRTITLKQLENRVETNTKKSEEAFKRVTTEIRRKNLKRGRVRPKDPTEEKILARFSRK